MAYKAEHVVDLDSEFVLAANVLPATAGDAETMRDSAVTAQCHLDAAATLTPEPRDEKHIELATGTGPQIEEIAADKGYHKGTTLEVAASLGYRTYIPERKQRRTWNGKAEAVEVAVTNNRRCVQRKKGKRLGRLRSELVERSFAHVCETGGARRTWLRGKERIQKRYSIQVAARNLGLVMLKLYKVGKPRGLQGWGTALAAYYRCCSRDCIALRGFETTFSRDSRPGFR